MTTGLTDNSLTGIVLAGGESSRMGQEKGLVLFRGKPLISYSLGLLTPFCDEILISANTQKYHTFGYPIITDEMAGKGPLGGIYSALKHASHFRNLILPCDTPFITKDFIRYLLASVRDQSAVIPVHPDGKVEPLCGYYSQDNIRLMKKHLDQGKYKLQDYLNDTEAFYLHLDEDLPFYAPHLFANLNRPEDLNI